MPDKINRPVDGIVGKVNAKTQGNWPKKYDRYRETHVLKTSDLVVEIGGHFVALGLGFAKMAIAIDHYC